MEKIGIFGGAFNPIHYGHLFIAAESLNVFQLKKIIFVPTGNHAFKKEDLLDKYTRFRLVKEATKTVNYFTVDDFEIKRESTSYFIYTLKHIIDLHPDSEIFSILGEDAFLNFHEWKAPEEILSKTHLIIAKRFEGNFTRTKEYIKKYFSRFEKKLSFLDHPLYPLSSRLIRKRIKNGKSISFLVPETIEKEIVKNGYYK